MGAQSPAALALLKKALNRVEKGIPIEHVCRDFQAHARLSRWRHNVKAAASTRQLASCMLELQENLLDSLGEGEGELGHAALVQREWEAGGAAISAWRAAAMRPGVDVKSLESLIDQLGASRIVAPSSPPRAAVARATPTSNERRLGFTRGATQVMRRLCAPPDEKASPHELSGGVVKYEQAAAAEAPSTLSLAEADINTLKATLEDKGSSRDAVLRVLRRFSDMPMTQQLLQSTGIGPTVRNLRHSGPWHGDDEVRNLVKGVIAGWKQQWKQQVLRTEESAQVQPSA